MCRGGASAYDLRGWRRRLPDEYPGACHGGEPCGCRSSSSSSITTATPRSAASQQGYFKHLVAADSTSGLASPTCGKSPAASTFPLSASKTRRISRRDLQGVLDREGPVVCEIMALPDEQRIPRVTSVQRADGIIGSRAARGPIPIPGSRGVPRKYDHSSPRGEPHMKRPRIGIMQGRLSPPMGRAIQAFPAEHWADEFPAAEGGGSLLHRMDLRYRRRRCEPDLHG